MISDVTVFCKHNMCTRHRCTGSEKLTLVRSKSMSIIANILSTHLSKVRDVHPW